MSNYFVLVSTHVTAARDSFYPTIQLPDLKLSIGWGEVNPLNKTPGQIKKEIEFHYPKYKGTVNPDNGAKSLSLFTSFQPGDVVFVRGVAKVLDVAVITGHAVYDHPNGHYKNDYYLKAPFVPLFSKQSKIHTRNMPDSIYDNIIYDGGRSIVMRQLEEKNAIILLRTIMSVL